MIPPLLLLSFIASAANATSPMLDPLLGRVVATCSENSGNRSKGKVWIFKQWHLSPSVLTTDRNKAKGLPQAKNQASVFKQLDAWVSGQQITTVVAEGCTGELTEASALKFNGWGIQELQIEASQPYFGDEILSSIPLKLEAKHGKALKTLCGEDEALLKKNGLAFSDARGVMGFLTRLDQYKDDPKKAKTYLEGVIEIYKLPVTTSIPQAMSRLVKELREAMKRVHATLDERNQKVVKVINQLPADGDIAVVYGGAHAAGLVDGLQKMGRNCAIVEPVGYQNDEALLIRRLDELIGSLQTKAR